MPRRAAVAKLLSAVLASAVAGGGVNATRFASGSVDAAEPGRFAAGWICTHVVGACREAAGGAERHAARAEDLLQIKHRQLLRLILGVRHFLVVFVTIDTVVVINVVVSFLSLSLSLSPSLLLWSSFALVVRVRRSW